MAEIHRISQAFRSVVVNGNVYLHHSDVESLLAKARNVQIDPEIMSNFNALQAIISDAARAAVNPLG